MLGRISVIFLLYLSATSFSAASENQMERCEQHAPPIGLVSNQQQRLLNQAGALLVRSSALRMAAGRDSTFADFYKNPTGREDPEIRQLLSRLEADQYRRILAHRIKRDETEYAKDIEGRIAGKKLLAGSLVCHQVRAIEPRSKESKALKSYLNTVLARPDSARIEHFDISIDSCEVRDTVGARNRAAEPEAWPDSRYLVMQTRFKNTDTEGRVPIAGSALLTMGSRTFEYDHTETVLEQGFGIGLQPVGPLLTLRTKIVYRIPRDATGEVFWKPGRNPAHVSSGVLKFNNPQASFCCGFHG